MGKKRHVNHTKRRKLRQEAASAAFKKAAPDFRLHTRLGTPIELTLDMLCGVNKQRLVEQYKAGLF